MLKDVQSEKDLRHIPLRRVGIRGLRWPLQLLDRAEGVQHTVARVNMAVALPQEERGTHMSRFVDVLQDFDAISLDKLGQVLERLKSHLQAPEAFLELRFPYFVHKTAPVSGGHSLLDLECVYEAEMGADDRLRLKVQVTTPITTLCPCSKEISDYGAHNQRAHASIEVELHEFVWIEELAQLAEAGASAPIYGLLKRPDEKFVTEQAYDNPRFVEDAVREIALRLEPDPRFAWYRVVVESEESIHNHNAYACVEKGWSDAV